MTLNDYLSSPGVVAKAFADRIGIPPPLLSQYRTGKEHGGRQIPDDRCPAIEFASGGYVTCEEQRPDLVWVRVKDRSWPHPQGRPLVDHSTKKAA